MESANEYNQFVEKGLLAKDELIASETTLIGQSTYYLNKLGSKWVNIGLSPASGFLPIVHIRSANACIFFTQEEWEDFCKSDGYSSNHQIETGEIYLRVRRKVNWRELSYTSKPQSLNSPINSERWRHRKRRVRTLTIAVGVIIITAIILAIALGVMFCGSKESKEVLYFLSEICITPECIHTASNILKWMDYTVDPCDDFYDFACGNFIKESKIADDETTVSTSSVSDDLVLEQLRALIEQPIQENETKPTALLKNLYRACMNKMRIEEIGLQEVKQLLSYFGGWPVVEGSQWNEDSFDWKDAIFKFEKAGLYTDYLLSVTVDIDEKNSTKRVLNIDQPFLVLSREFLLEGIENKFVQAYHSYMTDIAVIFGAEKGRAFNDMLAAVNFETKLANISYSIEEARDSIALYNPMTIKELAAKFTTIPWLQYINELLSPHVAVTEDEVVIVNSLKYLEEFEKLMLKTDTRVQANYLLWRAVSYSMSYLPDQLRNRRLQYDTVMTGETELVPRWKDCIIQCTSSLSIAADALYVRKYFNERAKKSAQELVYNIKSEFKKTLKHVDWMDEETREHALKKADMMVEYIGYPYELLDDVKLEEYYQGLTVNEASYFKSALNVSLFSNKLSFKKLHQPVNKTDWSTHSEATNVNAFYSPNENSIQFPAGILQGVYFNQDRPNYMNYGGIGFIIGHEITHGFDDDGRKYDVEGNLADWWVHETEAAFVKKAQCIVEQYGSYVVPELGQKLNGISSQGENIADNGGLKQAYLAYDTLVQNQGEEPKLPGLDFNGRQLFWISSANIWCAKTRPEILKQRLAEDFHSPEKFRVLGSLQNSEQFSKDFSCKEGSNMNPIRKCHLW
ncbi:zinc metalloprotease family m13 neprilysin-related [Holotrichia oblita]|uniref:Zinc metalloprotease family m13 neprilysin-related n=1 Tax=Holotrichia oblita TaxID=644536 RepID=A0ACB9TFE5_HOLOL|nr:zinc metalloprotease family m13 neprilysin-related [Holotrichia oblita]